MIRPVTPDRSQVLWLPIQLAASEGQFAAELEHAALATTTGRGDRWLVGQRMTQADITTSCVFTFLCDAVGAGATGNYSCLGGLTERCERLPEFRAARLPFAAPNRPS